MSLPGGVSKRRSQDMRLDPNRFASPAEAAILRAHIAEDELFLCDLKKRRERAGALLDVAEHDRIIAQEAEDSARTVYNDIDDLIVSVERRKATMAGRLHPVKKVPFELWRTIFMDAVDREFDDMDYNAKEGWNVLLTPFSVAQVCRLWRMAALDTPELWTRFVYDYKKMNSAVWLGYFETCIERTGTHELHLKIACNAPVKVRELSDKVEMFIAPLCRKIEVQFSPGAAAHEPQSVMARLISTEKLQELVITRLDYGSYTEDITVTLPEHAPNLKSIHFSGTVPFFTGLRTLENLSELFIQCSMATLSELDDLRRVTPALTSLHLDVQNLEEDVHTVVAWPGVKHLRISCPRADESVALAFRFPDLYHLNVSALSHPPISWEFWSLFALTACPQVQLLTIAAVGNTQEALMRMACLDAVTSLTLHCPLLREDLLNGLLANDEGQWPFPRLSKLSLEELSIFKHINLQPLRNVILARRDAFKNGQIQAPLDLERIYFGAPSLPDCVPIIADAMQQLEAWI